MNDIHVIAFDADDTLWENEPLFRAAERRWAEILSDYGSLEDLSARLFEVEKANMEDLGYGAKAFTLSLIETAIEVTGGKLTAAQTAGILAAGRTILHNPAHPLPGVAETLSALKDRYRLVLLTKGDLLDQEHKVERSGLEPYFERIVVVSDKSERAYRQLLKELQVSPDAFLMVGNSFKSHFWLPRFDKTEMLSRIAGNCVASEVRKSLPYSAMFRIVWLNRSMSNS